MKLTSMKMSKKERKKSEGKVADSDSGPDYPWGLSIDLENESMKKLNLKAKDFKAGATVMIRAKANVDRVSTEDVKGDGKSDSVRFQITDIAIDGIQKSKFRQFQSEKDKGPGE